MFIFSTTLDYDVQIMNIIIKGEDLVPDKCTSAPVAYAVVHSKAAILLLLIHCIMLLQLLVRVLCMVLVSLFNTWCAF